MAKHHHHNQRVYHHGDDAHRGPSVSLKAFLAGANPPPRTHQAPNAWQEVLAAARAWASRHAAPLPPVAPGACGPGVPAAPATLAMVVERQREQGLRA